MFGFDVEYNSECMSDILKQGTNTRVSAALVGASVYFLLILGLI